MAGDYEEKYLLLRDENLALKKKKNEQEATIKRMYTKLAMIEEAMKKKRLDQDNNQDDADAASAPGGTIPSRRDLETEKFVQALKSENAQLRKKNQVLMEKNRQLEEKMRQHQHKYHSNPKAPSASATNARLVVAKSTLRARSVAPPAQRDAVGYAADGDTLETQVDHARRVHRDHVAGDLEMALKNRLVVAEKLVVKLQQENEQLKRKPSTSVGARRRTSGGNNNALSDDDRDSSDRERAGDGMDHEQLRRELRDRHAQVAILNARYENLEATAAAEREIQEQTIEQLEHMNRQVHKLRSQLQDTALEKEELAVRLARAADLDKEMTMLRDQNRKLEERMTSLCESPFINDAFQRKERIDKLCDLEKQTQQQKAKIATMTDESQKLHVLVKELQSNAKLMKHAKEMVEHDMDKLRQQLVDERNARSLAAITTNFQPSVSSQPATGTKPASPKHTPLTLATSIAVQPDRRDAASSPLKGEQPAPFSTGASAVVPMVSRRYPDAALSGAVSIPLGDLEGPEGNSVKHLRNRIHVLQLAHLKAIQELERCEKMLHAQTNINRELAHEIEELTAKNVSSAGMLQKRLRQLELSIDEKQQRIQLLEAQNRQLRYTREKLAKAQESTPKIGAFATSSDEEDDDDDGLASVTESLLMAARDLSPGEQLLEIWILGAALDRSVVSANGSTFVLCDFYDFESQSTPLLVGPRPEYNFSSMFKVTVDAFFLRYLASETLVFELHQAIQGDFRLVGRASVPLFPLLRSKGVIKDSALPIKLAFGPDHDTVIGTLSLALRLAAPISEIWKLHLRSYPQDIQLVSKHRLGVSSMDPTEAYAFEDGFEDAGIKAVNELQITVFACRGLSSCGKKKSSTKPSSYVHYQILGFPDMFTNIVPSSSSPEFDLHVSKQFFTLEVDACLLQFFSKFELWFTVFDDQVDVQDDITTDGAIGRCGLSLDEITRGECLRGWFPLRDHHDHAAGEISVLVEWKDPFQVAQLFSATRRAGSSLSQAKDLHSLDYDQQHAIMRLFAPDMDGRVSYRQFLTYALPPESLELVTSKIKEQLEYAIDTEQLQCAGDLFTSSAKDPSSKLENEVLKEISIIELQKRLERIGVCLKDDELELLEQVFSSRSTKETEMHKIRVHYLLPHINPRVTCAERLLLHKIRHTLRVATRTGKDTTTRLDSPSQPFERYDPALCGFVSRAEFKRCLGVLGFELLEIDRAYKDFVEKETRQSAENVEQQEAKQTDGITTVDLDEETLSKETMPQSNPAAGHAPLVPNSKAKAVATMEDPRTEFDRRKQVFLERMKAVASSSAKSSVYEQLERQKVDRRVHTERANTTSRVEQQLAQLHVPKALHHDAARILQRQFRGYQSRIRHAAAATSADPATTVHIASGSLVEIDGQLSRMLKTWTRDDLDTLKATIIESIEKELPGAKKSRFVSRKQLGFVLSKIPRIAFEPDLLHQLTRHFTVASKDGNIAYRALVHFVCSVETEPKQHERPLFPLLKTLAKMHVDVSHVHQTFLHVGDVHATGCMSVKKFHEALERTGLRFPPKELRVLTVLLSDIKGIDVLYVPLLKLLRDSPVAVEMRRVVSRCTRFGIARLREALLKRVSSDDGQITREQLHSILMQENAEVVHFEPSDSYVLVEMTTPQRDNAGAATIAIDTLVATLERLGTGEPLSDDVLSGYKLPQLQRLAMSARSLLCPPYAAMSEAFERFDWKETGLVSLAAFAAVVPHVGLTLFTAQQIDMLAKHFGAKLHGTFGINYRQFLDWTTPSTATTLDVETIEKKLRRWVSDQVSETQPIAHILMKWRDAFARLDKLSTGVLQRAEFATVCMDSLQLPLVTDELRTVLFRYDRNMDDRVDYGAFVQLNWNETSRQAPNKSKRVQFEGDSPSLPDVLSRLHKALHTSRVTVEDVARVLAATVRGEDGHDSVDVTQFLVCLKQLGVQVPTVDASAIFRAHATADNRLRLVGFMQSALGLPSRRSSRKDNSESSLSRDDEDRLRTAVASALKYSRQDFERARAQLEEFCVVYDHGDIPSRKLRKHLARNGLDSLLSTKGTDLLIKKFTVESHIDCEEKDAATSDRDTVCVSLQKISQYLRDASNQHPVGAEVVGDDSASPLETALATVRQLAISCDSSGVSIRDSFEDADPRYTGKMAALEFKSILFEAGWTKVVADQSIGEGSIPSDALLGVLVREFRSADTPGTVHYAAVLAHATTCHSSHPVNAWVLPFAESLRGRIRLKAGLQGSIPTDQPIEQLCRSVDPAFAHFDQQKNGFLTSGELAAGLRPLKYELSSDQLVHFVTTASVFRHSTIDQVGLSRMEFDAFVLAPSASLMLRRLADLLYQPSVSDSQVPRVAQLSRLLISRDQPDHMGVLSLATAWATIQQVTQESLSTLDQRRLQILFDVKRDGMFAYKLFMKVMSQWRPDGSPTDHARPGPLPQRPTPGHVGGSSSTSKASVPSSFVSSRDDVLRALYNQLSSIDFDSQLEILRDHLQRHERGRGRISLGNFTSVIDHIGLKLSKESMACLQQAYRAKGSSKENDSVDYRAVLQAIQRLHHEDHE